MCTTTSLTNDHNQNKPLFQFDIFFIITKDFNISYVKRVSY